MYLQDVIANIKLDKKNLEYIEFLEEQYIEYYLTLKKCGDDFTNRFIKAYRKNEINEINSSVTKSKLLGYFLMDLKEETKICECEKTIFTTDKLSLEEIKNLHSLVMREDRRDYINKGEFRKQRATIGCFDENKNPIIHHEAPDFKMVEDLMNELKEYYNKDIDNNILNHPFIKPAVIQALTIYIQPFQDGNSRVGRIKHYFKLHQDANKYFNIEFERPSLYFCQRYMFDKIGYRKKLNNICLDLNNSDSWNKWFYYNLEVTNETLVNLSSDIETAKRVYEVKSKKLY